MTKPEGSKPQISVAHQGDGDRLHAPAAERNAVALTQTLLRVAPASGRALEIASGTGQHIAGFARAMPGFTWQPTEVAPERLRSIDAWRGRAENIRKAVHLDACTPGWGQVHDGQDLIVLVNLLHLVSTAQVMTLIAEAGQALRPSGRFVIYGPFLRDGKATSEGDARFDASLRDRDPAIGYKDVAEITTWLTEAGITVVDQIEMPANNLVIVGEIKQEDACDV